MAKIVLVTGGFDPIHGGHIRYLNHASHLGDHLVVGLNSDQWLTDKKGRPFMSWQERRVILDNLHMVGEVIDFNDSDGTAIDAIKKVKNIYAADSVIFANGGDRNHSNIPEMIFDDVEYVFGVGSDQKENSSSWLLDEWAAPKTTRPWGYYRVLKQYGSTVKVKEIVVDPGQSLSMQKHSLRSEHWLVAKGTATVYGLRHNQPSLIGIFKERNSLDIIENQWHQLVNETDQPLIVVEIQYGVNCIESDIERR